MFPLLIPLLALGLRHVYGKDAPSSALKPLTYTFGDSIPLSCLNRTIDTGEHIQDSTTGALQYIPFGICNETSSPLSIKYLDETEVHCTIADLSDEMYHLLEFYIHQDSPLACRVPARPLGGDRVIEHEKTGQKEKGMEGGEEWVPLLIALSGSLESSHLHISTTLNLLFHTSPAPNTDTIDSATAYSISPLSDATRIIIGDPLALTFRVRWYSGTDLPPSSTSSSLSHHGAGHTIFYCLISAGIGAGVMYAWAVGVAMPRRLKRVTMGMRGRDVGGIITGDVSGKGRGYGGYGGYANGGGNGTTEVKGYGGYGFGNGKRKD